MYLFLQETWNIGSPKRAQERPATSQDDPREPPKGRLKTDPFFEPDVYEKYLDIVPKITPKVSQKVAEKDSEDGPWKIEPREIRAGSVHPRTEPRFPGE